MCTACCQSSNNPFHEGRNAHSFKPSHILVSGINKSLGKPKVLRFITPHLLALAQASTAIQALSTDMMPCKFLLAKNANRTHEFLVRQGEPIRPHLFALLELLLRPLEIVVDVQALKELGDGVLVRVALLLDDLHQLAHHQLPPPLVQNDGRGEVAEEVVCVRLDGVQIPEGVSCYI
jgi:hypothetical protein